VKTSTTFSVLLEVNSHVGKTQYGKSERKRFDVHGSVHRKYSPIYIQQDATLHSLLYLETVLHVSGVTSTHNQERIQLSTPSGTGCLTRYRTRHFFNNFTTNEDITTKFEADLPHCERNVKEKNVLLFKFRCNIFIGVRIIKEMPGSVASGTPCICHTVTAACHYRGG